FNPAIRRNLLRTAEILRGEEELLDQLSGALYRRAVSPVEAAGILRLDSVGLAGGHQALQRRVIEMVLVELDAQPSFQHIDKVLALAVRGAGGGELHLAEGLRVIKRGPVLEFSHPAGRKRHRAGLAACGKLSFEKVIEGVGRWPIKELGLTLLVEVLDKAPDRGELSGMAADYLDMAELSFPLTVRAPRPGDRFHPLGGPGSRKVADFLSDCKVAREERGRVPVLTSGGEIVALLGLRIAHRCRLVDNSRKVLKVSVLPR
ncbi:MAG: tRNA lysidine(34) synthetase TilS, partial [Desulfurivibrionaceae bacterium]|nr:tRNA lysidine(34) synthetase TilS [Desulfurivibrionaceae bacterium]